MSKAPETDTPKKRRGASVMAWVLMAMLIGGLGGFGLGLSLRERERRGGEDEEGDAGDAVGGASGNAGGPPFARDSRGEPGDLYITYEDEAANVVLRARLVRPTRRTDGPNCIGDVVAHALGFAGSETQDAATAIEDALESAGLAAIIVTASSATVGSRICASPNRVTTGQKAPATGIVKQAARAIGAHARQDRAQGRRFRPCQAAEQQFRERHARQIQGLDGLRIKPCSVCSGKLPHEGCNGGVNPAPGRAHQTRCLA